MCRITLNTSILRKLFFLEISLFNLEAASNVWDGFNPWRLAFVYSNEPWRSILAAIWFALVIKMSGRVKQDLENSENRKMNSRPLWFYTN